MLSQTKKIKTNRIGGKKKIGIGKAYSSRHIILSGDGWCIVSNNSKKPGKIFYTRQEAIKVAKQASFRPIFIHTESGTLSKVLS